MNVQLPTGKTINISVYDYYFMHQDDEMDLFFQSCIADDLGDLINNPFSNRASSRVVGVENEDEELSEKD